MSGQAKTLSSRNNITLQHLAKDGNDVLAQAAFDAQTALTNMRNGREGVTLVVSVASTANVASRAGLLTIDSHVLTAGELVLLKNQSTASQNGVYVAGSGTWERLTDNDGNSLLASGVGFRVVNGSVNAGKTFIAGATETTISEYAVSGVSTANLASTSNGQGASLVGIEDALGLITGTTVEAALAELVKYEPANLADPGTGAAIPVTRSATVAMTVTGTETNTLAIPTFKGQRMIIYVDTFTSGTRAITAAQAINQAGNTVMTFAHARDFIMLVAISVGGALRWQVAANDGVALS